MILLLLASFFMGMINVGSILLPHFVQWNCIGVIDYSKLGFLSGMTNLSLLSPVVQVFSGLAYMTSMAIVPPLLKKFSKRKLWIWVSLIGAIANFIVFFVGIYIIPYNTLAGLIVYIVLRFFAHFPIGICLVLLMSMFADFVDELEMKRNERLEGTLSAFKGLLYKLSFAAFNLIILAAIGKMGYNADKMESYAMVGENYVNPLIVSTTKSSLNDIILSSGEVVNYTSLLNLIFFFLTAFVGFALILQAIPMFFVKDNEAEIEQQILVYRAEKEKELQEEFTRALAQQSLAAGPVADDERSA
jgi:Na+/melibiose symporter and related transporters